MLPDMWSKLHDIKEGKIIQNNSQSLQTNL